MAGFKVRILTAEGNVWETSWDPKSSVVMLKMDALEHFYPNESNLPNEYRLVYPGESRSLIDTHTFEDEKVEGKDTLILSRKRISVPHTHTSDGEVKAPTYADIMEATKHLPPPRKLKPEPPAPETKPGPQDPFEATLDFQLELRKIVISLVSFMATTFEGNPDVDAIIKEMHERVVLRLNSVADRPVEGTFFFYPIPPEVEATPMGIVRGFGELRKREFRPNPRALEHLREMGFSDEDIIKALKVNHNNNESATEWLLTGKNEEPFIEEDSEPYPVTSPLMKALLSNPVIRLGLSKPKIFYICLSIVENTSAANTWLTDNDVAPVLTAIFKVYHAEKHAVPEESE